MNENVFKKKTISFEKDDKIAEIFESVYPTMLFSIESSKLYLTNLLTLDSYLNLTLSIHDILQSIWTMFVAAYSDDKKIYEFHKEKVTFLMKSAIEFCESLEHDDKQSDLH